MFQTKVVEKIKTHILCSVFFFNRAVYKIMWKNILSWADHRPQYGSFALHAGYLRLQIPTVRLAHYNNACMNTPHCYVIRTVNCVSCSFFKTDCPAPESNIAIVGNLSRLTSSRVTSPVSVPRTT